MLFDNWILTDIIVLKSEIVSRFFNVVLFYATAISFR